MIIEPKRGWIPIDFGELWRYRELIYFLVWRDLKVRYQQTVLGATWAVIQPFMTMVVFTFFLGKLAKVPSDGIPYPLFSYCALLPWSYFANALSAASTSLIVHSNLISKVYFPRMIIPAAAALAGGVDFAVAFMVLLGMMAFYHVMPGLNMLLFPLLLLSTLSLAIGIGMWLSALITEYSDVRHGVPYLIQIWMFATPIVYPASLVPERYRPLLALNPMAGIIEGYRSALLNRPIEWAMLWISVMVCALALVSGALYFKRTERKFVDVI